MTSHVGLGGGQGGAGRARRCRPLQRPSTALHCGGLAGNVAEKPKPSGDAARPQQSALPPRRLGVGWGRRAGGRDPLSLPTLISITILKMMGAWNSYVWPNLVTSSDEYRLITNGLRNAFVESTGDVNIPVQMAAVAMVSAPLFLVFLFLRKYIMKGVSRSGIKG